MNILITAPSLNESENVSGISTIVRTIISNNDTSNKIFHFRIGTKDGIPKGFLWASDQLTLLPRLARFIRKNKIDLIHLNTALTGASLVRDFIIFSYLKAFTQKRVLLQIHGGPMIMTPPPERSLYRFIIMRMLKKSDDTVVLSQIEQHQLEKNFGASSKILPNAVEPFSVSTVDKSFDGKINFIFLGRIVTEKGIYVIANALKKLGAYHKEFNYTIYGTGKELQGLLEQLASIKTLQFEYKGVAKGVEKWQAFEKANVFLLPSLSGEGLPVSMLEAMYSGCIPVVSNDASITTVVRHNENGFVVKKGSEEDLYNSLKNILENRAALQGMSKAAQKTITEKYSISSYMKTLDSYYSTFFH